MQIVHRVLKILRALGESDEALTLQQLADELDIPPASMHRLLSTLMDEAFVVRDSSRRYSLGRDALALGGGRRNIADVARPLMRQMVAQTGETVFIAEMRGRRAVCTGLMEGTHALRLYVRAGQELPFNASAAARVLLSGFDARRVTELLRGSPIVVYTDHTLVEQGDIQERIESIQRRGHETCTDELDPGVWAVAAPVHVSGQRAAAALASAVPHSRLKPARKQALIDQVTQAAHALSVRMGGEAEGSG